MVMQVQALRGLVVDLDGVIHGPIVARPSGRRPSYAPVMVGEELRRLVAWSERHRRLLARIMIAFWLSVAVDLVGGLLMWLLESGKKGSEIHGFGDALFFSSVQILTVSSSLKNPITSAGKVVDVALELWAIFVVTAVAGSFASFFRSGDTS
jgi:uncharacterized membrane protein